MVELKEYLEIVFVIIASVFTVYTYTHDYYFEERSKVISARNLALIIVFVLVVLAIIVFMVVPKYL